LRCLPITTASSPPISGKSSKNGRSHSRRAGDRPLGASTAKAGEGGAMEKRRRSNRFSTILVHSGGHGNSA
jgi:hypothetical protein